MNTEELKLILDTVRSVADTAGTAGIIWVLVHYLVQLAGVIAEPIAWAAGVGFLAKHAAAAINTRQAQASKDEQERTRRAEIEAATAANRLKSQESENDSRKQIESIAEAAGVKTVARGVLFSSDLTKILAKVKA
jgi:ABC-type bacteriocin/lantibiotic exporter with double-glycine peptidase domain